MAGKYAVPFTWKKWSSATRDAHNNPVRAWTDQGILWGSLEAISSHEGDKYGGERTRIDATVRVHQLPQMTVQDILVDSRYGESWIVESFSRDHDANELIVSVYQEPGRAS